MDITTTAHPGTLTTAEDYANAPVGTIVAEDGSDLPKVKHEANVWAIRYDGTASDEAMAGVTRKVLRWGRHA